MREFYRIIHKNIKINPESTCSNNIHDDKTASSSTSRTKVHMMPTLTVCSEFLICIVLMLSISITIYKKKQHSLYCIHIFRKVIDH